MLRATSVLSQRQAVTNGHAARTHFRRKQEPRRIIEWARCGDHFAVYQLLRESGLGGEAQPGPSRDEFQAALDDPFYEPTDRLLIRQQGDLAAHVHIVKRTIWYAGARLAVGRLAHLVVAPQFAGHGLATPLLHAAEKQLVEDGAVMGVVTTRSPLFYLRQGWSVVQGGGVSRASVRQLLPVLRPQPCSDAAAAWVEAEHAASNSPPLSIRLWKHFELAALQRIHQQVCRCRVGPIQRSEDYWHWLVSRRAYDRIYVAIEGPDRLELQEGKAHIVGYAVVRSGEIVELAAAPDHPTAAVQLLSRVAGDELERDNDALALHAPADDPLHERLLLAGGTYCDPALAEPQAGCGAVTLAKIVQPQRMLQALSEVLHQRAAAAGLARPCELALCIDGQRFALALSRRSVKVVPQASSRAAARHSLRLTTQQFTRLVLGQAERLGNATTMREREPCTRNGNGDSVPGIAGSLFPSQLPWWTAWDELTAR